MTDPFYQFLGYSLPILVALMVAASVVHAAFAVARPAPAGPFFRPRVVIVCLAHLIAAAVALRALNEGGWLTASYHWNDPDDVNLVAAIFEVLCIAGVIALLIMRKRFLYRLLLDFLVIQAVFAVAFLALVLLFVLTWHPRMM